MNWKGREIESLHLGLTYKCTLGCLECARTYATKNKIPDISNTVHVDYKNYTKLINKLNPSVIDFCGNWGDPIYYPDLIPLVRFIREKEKELGFPIRIRMHTNGSYRDKEFWNELGTVMTPNDYIFFSIDGTRENFTNYRVNSDIKSIDIGIQTLLQVENKPTLIQKTICFSYNKWKLVDIVKEAIQSNFDYMRFDWPHVSEHEWLRPDFSATWAWKVLKLAGYDFSYPKSDTDMLVKPINV